MPLAAANMPDARSMGNAVTILEVLVINNEFEDLPTLRAFAFVG